MGQSVDRSTLKAIADETGGIYQEAKDARSLKAVYKEIDELERSEIESIRFMDYKEKFLPFVLAALVLLLLEFALANTLFRKIP